MSRRAAWWRAGLAAVLAACWAAAIAWPHLSSRPGPVDGLEAILTDLRLVSFGRQQPTGEVIIVAIDDAALADPDFGALDGRARLARLVAAIGAAGPRAIGLDVILADPGDPEIDAELSRILGETQAVIAAGAGFDGDAPSVGPPNVLGPQPVFAKVAPVGLVNLSTDRNGTPRHVPMVMPTDAGLMQSLALRVAAARAGSVVRVGAASVSVGENEVPLDTGSQMPLRLLGPSGTIPTVGALDVLSGAAGPMLEDRAVLVGFTATAFGDRFATPFGQDMPGVEVIATAVNQLLGGEALRRDTTTRRIDLALSMFLAASVAAIVVCLPLAVGVPVAAGLVLAGLAGTWLSFAGGIWLSAGLPMAICLPVILVAGTARHLYERREAARTTRGMHALKAFQSPALADLIASDPAFLRSPETRDLVVLFVDLSGFTALSQALGPDATQTFLKRFHQVTTDMVESHDGVVLNYMGDGAMAVFGLKGDPVPAARDALACGFDLVAAIATLKATGQATGSRVGIHAGPVILSRLGGARQQQVTVTGDTVNLASRLMEVAKDAGASIAATGEVLARQGGPEPRPPDTSLSLPVRGRIGMIDAHLWRA
ncbi:adenylate/guanylate cyclase domain-containing protein [Sulfitobacter sp. D35]|uniref:CHASE2 domain-containing protein n=1 Tax=Sulfitobacter sp. D35 TaxID=3083252 RepID=UPI00296FD558|nr:adenylate/guanylate cyclase domain-containing protein [Sulfitobacter sp. D35]MDW4499893.1 adenylate/guanylate cyclase domain-containing protein [Sulfitobacter sp. D35]